MPYPADYGGVSDVFYKIKALHKTGIKIHLHCFDYGRGVQSELNKYCKEVNYYKRNTGWAGFSFQLPYIVKSRANKLLLKNLLKDDYPVLMEGIHCTYFLYNNQLKNKKTFVRLHNVEFKYYHQLIKNEASFLKKIYLENESRLLKKYEKKIADKAMFLTITQKDLKFYQEKFSAKKIKYLPAFVPFTKVISKEGNGEYCLYHGNLSVPENEQSALWLIENVFNQSKIPFIVAGKNPSKTLIDLAEKNENVRLIQNPSEQKMNELISNAHINVLPSFKSTGIKIKLLNALFTGRHCLVNNATIEGTNLSSLCHIEEAEDEFNSEIQHLFKIPFTGIEIEKRKELLMKEFNNETNAKQLMQWIY